jgi:proton glutamate symport protein
MRKIPQYLQIIISLIMGVFFAILSAKFELPASFTIKYIKPFGTIFLNSLKVAAIPLIFASLVVGVSSVESTAKLSRIGIRALMLYTLTTVAAVIIGLFIASIVKPGYFFPEETRIKLMELYAGNFIKTADLSRGENTAPLQFLVDLIPSNFFSTLTNNLNLLQVVVLAIVFGIALLKIDEARRDPVIRFFSGINSALIEVVKIAMKLAPIGVFSLVTSMLVEVVDTNSYTEVFGILYSLACYTLSTIAGLIIILFIVYPIMIKGFSKMSCSKFFKGIFPAQLVAFTTSSSSASLPILLDNAENNLEISGEISNFVLPLGATVNMNGTALYLGVTIVFIAQALGINLSFTEQLSIVAYATVSAVGVAGVPGAAIVATTMILQTLGIPAAGLAIILIPEHLLDMCRTVVNITGDAAVAVLVDNSENGVLKQVEK